MVTRSPAISSGLLPPLRLKKFDSNAAMSVNTSFCFFQSRKFAAETTFSSQPRWGFCSHTITSRSASLYGSGLSKAALTMVKMAALAPMPNASISTAADVNPGLLRNCRSA